MIYTLYIVRLLLQMKFTATTTATDTAIPTRISRRVNKFKGSFYESDQEDNSKDENYNPNEYYEKIKKMKSASTVSSSLSDFINLNSKVNNIYTLQMKKYNPTEYYEKIKKMESASTVSSSPSVTSPSDSHSECSVHSGVSTRSRTSIASSVKSTGENEFKQDIRVEYVPKKPTNSVNTQILDSVGITLGQLHEIVKHMTPYQKKRLMTFRKTRPFEDLIKNIKHMISSLERLEKR